MLSPRLTNCPECANIPSLLKKIDCKLAELGNNLYNNISYMLNKPVPANDITQLIGYRRILMYKLCNPSYVEKYSVAMIASKVIRLTVGCVSRCNTPEPCVEVPCNITIVPNTTSTSTTLIPTTTTTSSSSTSTSTSTSTSSSSTTTSTTTAVPTTTTTSSSSTSTTTTLAPTTTTTTTILVLELLGCCDLTTQYVLYTPTLAALPGVYTATNGQPYEVVNGIPISGAPTVSILPGATNYTNCTNWLLVFGSCP